MNFRSGRWIGYKDDPLRATLQYKKPVTVSSVSISSLVDIGSYIMPPAQVEVWGGNTASNLRLLKSLSPDQPKEQMPNAIRDYEVRFDPATVQVVKIVVTPVPKLPAWHPGKGEKAWIFLDEIFLN